MSYYYKYLFEDFTPKQPTKQTIYLLIEGYNPDLVKKVAEKFIDYAEEDGFIIPNDSIEQSNQFNRKLYSCYFKCEKENNTWRIRVADHKHNNDYDNSSNYQIIVDDTELDDSGVDNFTKSKYSDFRNSTKNTNKTKYSTLNKIQTSNLCYNFIKLYNSNPKWFPKLLQKYEINPDVKNYDWFKIAFQNKCEEIINSKPKLRQKYSQTFIYDWKPGERLNHF